MTPIRFQNVNQLREAIFEMPLDQYILIQLDNREIEISEESLHRFVSIASQTDSSFTYSYYRERNEDGSLHNHPVIDYQPGAVRDDFNFGPLVLLNAADVLSATEDFTQETSELLDGGWYALRLRLTIGKMFAMIPEYLYTARRVDYRLSGEKQHDYVDPRNREYQLQMEKCLTQHLQELHGMVEGTRESVDYDSEKFPVEASVIIPVRNRVKTIGDALQSALTQEASFDFNVIVVDNDSTDGTREYLRSIQNPRLHLIEVSESENLGIGGCWNRAISSEHCGRFAIQLDSDDIYNTPNTVERIVNHFRNGNFGMVVGSYEMVDFNGNPLPPGLISHDEWTDVNGANNALRIHGFGAPRAFFTPLVREFLFPNVSYGEDYAMALRISRQYGVGRIFDSLYLCRRWEGNSDATLSVEKENSNHTYKDFIRTVELMARVRINMKRHQEQGPMMSSLFGPDGWEPLSDGDPGFDDDFDDDFDEDDLSF